MQEAEGRHLLRLNTDYIDLYQIHGFDRITPLEEAIRRLPIWCATARFAISAAQILAAWQIMKSLGISALAHLENSSPCRPIIRSRG